MADVMDVGALAGTYRANHPPRRLRRIGWVAVGAGFLAAIVIDVVAHQWPVFPVVYPLWLVWWTWALRRRPLATVVDAEALHVRPRLGGRLWTIPWEDVLAIQPATRWQENARAVTRRNGELPLPGLTAPDADALATLVAAAHPELARLAATARVTPPRTVSPRPEPVAITGDIDWDGPFTRSRR